MKKKKEEMNNSDTLITKNNQLLRLQERSLDELKFVRSKLLIDPLDYRMEMTDEIIGDDPFKNLSPQFKNSSNDLNILDKSLHAWMENEVVLRKSRGSTLNKRKNESENLPRFRWEKRNSAVLTKEVQELKKSSNKLPRSSKNESLIKEKKREEKQIIVVSSYNDLPKKFQKEVEIAKIPIESIEQNFFSLLNILHFCEHGTIFVLKEGDMERKTTSQKKAIPYDIKAKECKRFFFLSYLPNK